MINWHKIVPTLVASLLLGTVYAQQDALFNTGFTNPAFVNPGFAGNTEEDMFCASAFNRLELTKFDGAPTSTIVNVHGPIDILGIHSGISVTLQNELAGYLRAPGLSLGYAYRRNLWKGEIGIGLSVGFISSWYANNNWRTPDGGGIDPAVPTQENAGFAVDMGTGVYYSDSVLFGGLSFTHLTRPSLGVDRNARYRPTMYAMGGYTIGLDSNAVWALKPMVHVVSDFRQTSVGIGCNVMYENKYWGGLHYRWQQAVAAMIGFEILGGLKVGYAYEYATSRLSRFSGGTHELMVSYSFSVKTVRGTQKYKSVRYL